MRILRNHDPSVMELVVLPTFVFWICKRLGDNIKATRDVENNISITAMFPSLAS
jgi:hypothetical protein